MAETIIGTALWDVQKAMVRQLQSDALLRQRAHGIYDGSLPVDANNITSPYVVFDSWTELGDNALNRKGRQVTVQIHVFSQRRGLKEAHLIQDRIIRLLDEQAIQDEVSGWAIVKISLIDTVVLTEPDEMRHVSLRFRFWCHRIMQ